MYSEKIVNANLDEFGRREGWRPTPHTLDEIAEFKAYIASITDVRSSPKMSGVRVWVTKEVTKRRADEIRRFIENEQILCSLDANYWIKNYAFICDEKGEVIKFVPRESQKVFASILAQFEEGQISIELLILKARQLGVTTATVLYFAHRVLFVPHTQAVMASVQQEKSELIQRITDTCVNNLPFWLGPLRVRDNTKFVSFDNSSVISIQSGSQATGIAQGWTPTCVHVSEIGDIPNPKKTIEEGLLRATHSSRKLFLVLEGTGNGNTGWQADKWRSAKEDWPKGRSRLCPIFIPWPMARDLYPEKDWLRKFPIPGGWQAKSATRAHVRRCELYIRNTDYLNRIVGKDWTMPREQQWFWEFNHDQAVKSHTEKVWSSQMPADDREALVGQNDSVFEQETIEVCNEGRERNYEVFGIMGDTMDKSLQPIADEIDYDKPRIIVDWKSHRGTTFEWQLVPLLPLKDENVDEECFGKILVFERPKDGYDYTIGIDNAHGLGKPDEDRSVLSIAHNVYGDNFDTQVAELCSNRINSAQMVGFAACMAAWYGKNSRDHRGVKFCIEQVTRPGDDCQNQLRMMGFSHHHGMVRYDSKKVPRQGEAYRQGWYTFGWSRGFLLTKFTEAIKGNWYKPNSPGLIRELGNFERKFAPDGREKMIAQTGKKDDRLFAAALSYISRHDNEVLVERQQKRYSRPTGRLPEVDYGYAAQNQISVGEF
jgi:hypothetical protein